MEEEQGPFTISRSRLRARAHLVRLVVKAEAVAVLQQLYVVRLATLGELVRLNVLQADDRLHHDAPVPVAADALAPWKKAAAIITRRAWFPLRQRCANSRSDPETTLRSRAPRQSRAWSWYVASHSVRF